jgi:hypothetical protein
MKHLRFSPILPPAACGYDKPASGQIWPLRRAVCLRNAYAALAELEAAYQALRQDPAFRMSWINYSDLRGPPDPLSYARHLSAQLEELRYPETETWPIRERTRSTTLSGRLY